MYSGVRFLLLVDGEMRQGLEHQTRTYRCFFSTSSLTKFGAD